MSHASRSAIHARVGGGLAAGALEAERSGHDPDRERAELARDPRDDRCRTGAGAAALACGDEHQVGASERALDLVVGLLGRLAPDVGIRARAEPLGELAPDVDLQRRVVHLQLLDVGVDRDELDPCQAGVDHPVERVQPGPADPDDADNGQVGGRVGARSTPEPRGLLGQRLDPAGRGALLLYHRLLHHRLGLGDGCGRRGRRGRDVLVHDLRGRRAGSRRELGLGPLGLRPAGLLGGRAVRGRFLHVRRLALGGLGGAEQLRERALTHACALSRH